MKKQRLFRLTVIILLMLTLPTFLTSMVGADLPPTGQGYGGTFQNWIEKRAPDLYS